jgi:BON domain-containing protein
MLASIFRIKRISERQSLSKTAPDCWRRFLLPLPERAQNGVALVFDIRAPNPPLISHLFLGKLPMEGALFDAKIFGGEKRVMKILKRIFWIAPLALLIAGCAAPDSSDATYAEWRREELLPPTGYEASRVYSAPKTYPAVSEPNIIVQTEQGRNSTGDLALADAIRQEIEGDRGIAPSMRDVFIEVRDGRVTLRGSVKSDLDARVIVDDLRNVAGVNRITNSLEINPSLD